MVARVELVTIGTELLLGFTIDTNAAHIGRKLSGAGVEIVRRTSVGDTPDAVRDAVSDALARTGAVITTGGLGPTRDDMSKNVVAELLNLPLEFSPDVWEMVLARYRRFGRTPVESNRSQAMVPRGAVVLPNQWGTAPGLWIESARGTVIMLPGVPLEMRKLLEQEVLPRLESSARNVVIASRTLRTAGVPESTLAEQIADIEDQLAPITLAYLPSVDGVDLRLTAWRMPASAARDALQHASDVLAERIGIFAYGNDDEDLAQVVLRRIKQRAGHLALAESCTGGMLGARITAVPGASEVFVGGVVAYDNRIKVFHLGVDPTLIEQHGAVSGEVAQAMASGAANRFGVSIAIAVTGIAGPGGGSATKPVGTVWFGLAMDGKVSATRQVFGGDREEIRARATQGALMMLWRALATS